MRGESGSGESRRAMTAVQAEERVHAGVHWLWRTSRQISPDVQETFGWKMRVVNFIVGGCVG